ncbi:GL20199 [Drosophila persimilis]|uniref:GL20199 n=1 Tax=Drosophila persimilis TaxID=7234 RepID=B4GXU6_DROPE|nr:GL20199 [Drosophila persimilis]
MDGGGEAPDDEAALAVPEARAQAKVERRHLIEHMRLGSDGSSGSSSSSSMAALASVLPNICSYDYPTGGHHYSGGHSRIEKIVNPLGTVTDVNAGISGELQTDMLDEVVCQLAAEESVIHENCDEALFRPVVAIFCNDLVEQRNHQQQLLLAKEEQAAAAAGLGLGSKGGENDHCKPPVVLANKLIVPVIAKEVDEVLVQKEKQKSQRSQHQKAQQQKSQLRSLAAAEDAAQAQRFAELSHLNKPKGGANPSPSNNSNNSNNSKTASSQRNATEEAAEKEEEKEKEANATLNISSGGKASKKSKPARQKMILSNSSTSSSKGADKKLPSVETNYFTKDQLDGLSHNNNNNNNNNIIFSPGKGGINKPNNVNPNVNASAIGNHYKSQRSHESAVDSSLAGAEQPPPKATQVTQVSYDGGELSTVVNIEVFDDQLSMSSISTNSRLSLEGPPSQSSPPLSLTNGLGLMDTNLMHFSESTAATRATRAAAAGPQPDTELEVEVDLDAVDEGDDEAVDQGLEERSMRRRNL